MIKILFLTLLIFASFFTRPISTSAQDDEICPSIVEQAFEALENNCDDTGRNQLCYGNPSLEVDFQSTEVEVSFNSIGDIIDIYSITRLSSSPLDTDTELWGIALMSLQSNLPDTLPGQNVTFLIFGDTTVSRTPADSEETTSITLESNSNANVRQAPSTTSTIIDSLTVGDEVIATGRLADDPWIRIVLSSGEGVGWVFGQLVSAEGIGQLPIVEATDIPDAPSALEVFYFSTGVGDSLCTEMPNSGVLIRTPEGTGEVTVELNQVTIHLASTAFLQAIPGDEMRISMLEGRGRFEAFGVEQIALGGTQVNIPINSQLVATGPPSLPVPCQPTDLQGLPVEFWSCTTVEVHLSTECPATIPSNIEVLISLPTGQTFESRAEAEEFIATSTATIRLDGETVDFAHEVYALDQNEQEFGYDLQYLLNSIPVGVYEYLGEGVAGEIFTCQITVVDTAED